MRRPALLLALAALLAAGCGGGGERPPASGSAGIVPGDALVYLHVSTEPGRPGVKRALALARKFPDFPTVRDAVFRRLAIGGRPVDFARDVRPWLGDEAALALLNSPGRTAGSLIVLAVSDPAKARAFLARAGAARASVYRRTRIATYGAVATAFVRSQLVIGPAASLRQAIDTASGARPSLAANPTFRRASSALPSGRAADAWASRDGVRRLLEPQAGLLGAAGSLLDNPALQGTALALTAGNPGARVSVHSILAGRAAGSLAFEPKLLGSVPKDALAYLGIAGLGRAVGPLLSAAAPAAGSLAGLLRRAQAALARQAGTAVLRDLAPVLKGEVALAVVPRLPAAVLTLIAKAPDPVRTQAALARLQGPVAKLLRRGGTTPAFRQTRLGGTTVYSLTLASALELDYAVVGGKLVLSTSLDGIRAVQSGGGSLSDAPAFKTTLGDRPKQVTSVVFLDLNQLLTLAEQTGLNSSPAYARVRDDLRRIQAVGAETSGGEGDTTAELRFQIP